MVFLRPPRPRVYRIRNFREASFSNFLVVEKSSDGLNFSEVYRKQYDQNLVGKLVNAAAAHNNRIYVWMVADNYWQKPSDSQFF